MLSWILALAVFAIPCYFGVLQIRELVTAARNGELKCPIRHNRRSKLEFVE